MEIVYFHPDIKSFIASFGNDTAPDIFSAFDILASKGYLLSMPLSKKVEKGLYELRIQGRHNVRVFYTFHKEYIVLLHIIEKKTQKLRLQDLNTARKRLRHLHS
jgi:phage-related protein